MDFIKAAEILDLKNDDFFRDVKKKYKRLVLMCHPDRYQNETAKKRAEKRLKEVNEAYWYFVDNYNEIFDKNGKNKTFSVNDTEFNEEVLKRLRDIANSLAQFNDDSFGDYNEDFDSDEVMDDREFFRKYYPEVDYDEFIKNNSADEYTEISENSGNQYEPLLEDFPKEENKILSFQKLPLWIKIALIGYIILIIYLIF